MTYDLYCTSHGVIISFHFHFISFKKHYFRLPKYSIYTPSQNSTMLGDLWPMNHMGWSFIMNVINKPWVHILCICSQGSWRSVDIPDRAAPWNLGHWNRKRAQVFSVALNRETYKHKEFLIFPKGRKVRWGTTWNGSFYLSLCLMESHILYGREKWGCRKRKDVYCSSPFGPHTRFPVARSSLLLIGMLSVCLYRNYYFSLSIIKIKFKT